jgi:hypothetical protein
MSDKPNGTPLRAEPPAVDATMTCDECAKESPESTTIILCWRCLHDNRQKYADCEVEEEREHRLRETARADRERTLRMEMERRLREQSYCRSDREFGELEERLDAAIERAEAAELELGRLRAQLATLRKGAG